MENILEVYAQDIDSQCPRICFDERPILLVDNVVEPLAMKKGKNKRIDYEYKHGEAVVALLAYNMDTGQRHVTISHRKTKIDYAQFMADIINTHYKDVPKVRIIQDNLNTHTKGSFYKAFGAELAGQLRRKTEFHFTPKHASWLNMAEIEFSALSRQCLNRRFDGVDTLVKQVNAWEKDRNERAVKIHWSFTVTDAQVKLARHYCNVFQYY